MLSRFLYRQLYTDLIYEEVISIIDARVKHRNIKLRIGMKSGFYIEKAKIFISIYRNCFLIC